MSKRPSERALGRECPCLHRGQAIPRQGQMPSAVHRSRRPAARVAVGTFPAGSVVEDDLGDLVDGELASFDQDGDARQHAALAVDDEAEFVGEQSEVMRAAAGSPSCLQTGPHGTGSTAVMRLLPDATLSSYTR